MTRFRPLSANFALQTTHLLLGASLALSSLPAAAEEASTKPAVAATGAAAANAGKDKPAAPGAAKSTANASAAAAPAAPPASASAPAPSAEATTAKAELEAGRAAYTSGDYAAASEHFGKSLAAAESAEAQYWLAMSLDLQGKSAEAYVAFDKLAQSPQFSSLPEELQNQAKARSEVLGKIPASIQVNVTPANAALSVDGAAQAGASPFALKLAPGKHSLEATSAGFEPARTDIEVKPAETGETALELKAVAKPAAPVAPPAPPPAPERDPIPAYITLGVAGASAVVGGIFGISALGAKSDYDKAPTAARADAVERDALIADMAFGVALTLGITGIVLLTTDEPAAVGSGASSSAHAKLQVSPFASPTSAGASARLQF